MTQDILQSEGWEKFQQALGRKTKRIDGVLAIEISLPFGKTYLYSPRSSSVCHPEVTPKDLTSNRAAIFWRAEFGSEFSILNSQFSIPRVLKHALEPEWTWRTQIDGTDDDLLAKMHEKHRYNIRVAAKRGVVVRADSFPASSRAEPSPVSGINSVERPRSDRDFSARSSADSLSRNDASGHDFDACWALLQETAKRQGISTHPRHYYETMLATLPNTKVHLAEHSGTPVACAIVAYYGDTATYLHGGSLYEYRSLMAPHLLHWTAMRDARAAKMKWYEWGGIESQASGISDQHRSDWPGMTRFKKGFGGEVIHHPPMRDLVFRPKWYTIFSWLARLRR